MSETPERVPVPSMAAPASETRDVMLSLDKAVKAVKMYLPNNPQYGHFLDRCLRRFAEYFRMHPELRLEVRRFELLAGGEVVYANENRSDSLAFVLHKDGVREIVIEAGVEDQELRAFVQAFNRDFTREYLDDDLVTCFWEKGFRHIRYTAGEDFMDEFLPPEIARAPDRDKAFLLKGGFALVVPAEMRDMIAGKAAAGNGTARPQFRQAHLRPETVRLGSGERERVAALIRDDASRQFFPYLIETIMNILKLEKEPQAAADLLDLLRRFVEMELDRGDFSSAAGYLRQINAITGSQDYHPETRERARILLGDMAAEAFVDGPMARALVAKPDADPEDVSAFVAAMPLSAARHLLNLFDRIESMKSRKALCRGLAFLIRDDIGAIAEGLEDSRWYVVRNTVFVIGMIRSPQAIAYLRKALGHPESRVRREVIKTVLGLDSGDVAEYVLAALEDPDERLRIFTLKSLTRRLGKPVRQRLAENIASPSFRRRTEEERRQHFAALARIGDEDDLAPLERALMRRAWFRQETAREQKWVAEALALSENGKALEILRRCAGAAPGSARELCRKAQAASRWHGRKEEVGEP